MLWRRGWRGRPKPCSRDCPVASLLSELGEWLAADPARRRQWAQQRAGQVAVQRASGERRAASWRAVHQMVDDVVRARSQVRPAQYRIDVPLVGVKTILITVVVSLLFASAVAIPANLRAAREKLAIHYRATTLQIAFPLILAGGVALAAATVAAWHGGYPPLAGVAWRLAGMLLAITLLNVIIRRTSVTLTPTAVMAHNLRPRVIEWRDVANVAVEKDARLPHRRHLGRAGPADPAARALQFPRPRVRCQAPGDPRVLARPLRLEPLRLKPLRLKPLRLKPLRPEPLRPEPARPEPARADGEARADGGGARAGSLDRGSGCRKDR